MADETKNETGNENVNGYSNTIPKWVSSAPWFIQIAMYVEKNYGKFGLGVLLLAFVSYRVAPWVSDHIVDPTIKTYNKSIEATTDANLINAEANRQNSETQKITANAIAEIQRIDKEKMDKLDDISVSLRGSMDRMHTVVEKMQSTEDAQTAALKEIAGKLKATNGG
jgi:hypothetical protein